MISAPVSGEVDYPAEFHFRIICNSNADVIGAINAVACGYTVTKKLDASNTSASGNFCSYSISVIFASRLEMIRFDTDIKAVPGVRVLI